MKRSRWIKMMLSFTLAMCLVAGSIDWSFLGANADEIESVAEAEGEPIDTAEEPVEEGMTEEIPDETGEEPVNEMIEELVEEPSDDPADEIPDEDMSEEPVEEPVEVPAEDLPLDIPAEEVADLEETEDETPELPTEKPVNEESGTEEPVDKEPVDKEPVDEEQPSDQEPVEEVIEVPAEEEPADGDIPEETEPRSFQYADDSVTVTAVCAAESGIPEEAELLAIKLEEGSDAYQEAYAALLSTMELDKNETLLFLPYDVYFLHDGERIEPVDGLVQVRMEFADTMFETSSEDEVLGDVFGVHIKEDGEVEDLNADVSESGISFEVESFSVMGAAAVSRVSDMSLDAYAILYEDGTMVFQRGDTPDTEYGAVVESWTGFEDIVKNKHSMMPWYYDGLRVTSVIFKDTIKPLSLNKWFYGFKNCMSMDVQLLDTSSVTDMNELFYQCEKLQSLDLSSFDTSCVTDIAYIFTKCHKLVSLDLSSFDTSSVTNMSYMFYECSSLQSLDLSSFNTHAVMDMSHMFENSYKLVSLDLSSFDTCAVMDMHRMFCNCNSLQTLDLSSFNTHAVTNMSAMFYQCYGLMSLDLSSFNTHAVTDMSTMFYNCHNLQTLNVSSFDTRVVTDMNNMFNQCSLLQLLDLSSFDTRVVTDMNNMFYGCYNLQTLDLSNFNTRAVTNMMSMFTLCCQLQVLDLSYFDTGAVTNMESMFSGCRSLQVLDLSHFDTSAVINMGNMFNNCAQLQSLDLSSFDTRAVTNMSQMFMYCQNLQSLNLSNFDTHSVTSMYAMFYGCENLESLDLSSFDTSQVTSMYQMFRNCYNLQLLDLSSFDTSSVTDMINMFYDCNSLPLLNVSSFDLRSARSISGMFQYCSSLKSLDLSDFDTSAVTNMQNLFYGCSALTSLDLSSFDTSKVNDMSGMFYNCSNLRSLDLSNFSTESATRFSNMFNLCNQLVVLKLPSNMKPVPFNLALFTCPWMQEETGIVLDNFYEAYSANPVAGTYRKLIDITFDSIHKGKQTVFSYIGATINSLPKAPDVTARYFDGWFTENTGGTQLLPSSTIEQDTYYAHWTDYQYTLVLKPNGGDGEDIISMHGYYETFRLPGAVFAWEEKTFTGWNTRKDGSGTHYEPKDYVRSLTNEDEGTIILYAEYSDPVDNMVTVTFDTNGGTPVSAIYLASGKMFPMSSIPSPIRMNYTFIGWSSDREGNDLWKANSSYQIKEDITLYAQWGKNPLITFDTQGMGSNQQRTILYDNVIGSLPEYPPYHGRQMSLIGWFTEPTGGEQITSATKVIEDTTFYAHWGWKPKFRTNGGKMVSEETFEIQEGSSIYTIPKLPTAEQDGYVFDGWYLDGEKLEDGCSVDLSDGIAIEAHWSKKDTVTITFKSMTGSNGNSTSTNAYNCYQGESLGAFPKQGTPYKSLTGYGTVYARFIGWMDENGKYYTTDDVFTEDITLTAQFTWQDVILTFDADGGSGISGTGVASGKMSVPSGTTLFTLPGAKKTNYILEGWYTEKEGQGEKLTTETVLTENRIYYAHWIPFFLNGSDPSSLYVYGAEWSNASNTNATNLDNMLEMHPSSNTNQTASLHIRFELNRSIESSEELVLPVGAVKIRIPKYIWKDWNGKDTGTNNLSANLPLYPAVRNGMWFSYMEDGDDYILINSKELSGTAGLDLTVSYNITPANVPGGASDVNGRYLPEYDFYQGEVPVRFSVDNDLDGNVESEMTRDLTVEMHTTATLSGSKEKWGGVFYSWDHNWGPKPDDADDYFYIRWEIKKSYPSGIRELFQNVTVSEDSVHDGTVVHISNSSSLTGTSTVYTRHLRSLLYDASSSGLVLKNTAFLNGTLKSGQIVSVPVTASTTVYHSTYPSGEYAKKNTGSAETAVKIINGGQETVLDDLNTVGMNWFLTYSGGSNMVPSWNEETGTYIAQKRTIRIRDGMPGDVLYSSGTASSKYVWEPDTGNTVLSDEDYYFSSLTMQVLEYDSKFVDGTWSSPSINYAPASWDGVDLYVRHAGSEEFVFYGHYNCQNNSQMVTFRDNDIVGFEVVHDSDYYSTTIHVNSVMQLKPTNHVKMLLQDDVDVKASSIIKNSGTCDIWPTALGEDSTFFHAVDNSGGDNAANKNCYELNVSKTTRYTRKTAATGPNIIYDVTRGTQDSPMYIDTVNYNSGNRFKKMNAGIFYDLLPEGTSVDPDSVFGIPIASNSTSISVPANNYNSLKNSDNRIDKGYYDVRFVQNWEDSGRTMMIIKWGVPDSFRSINGMSFYYLLHNTYENVMEHGTTVENDVASVDLTERRTPPNANSGALSTITQKMYYQELDEQYAGNIGYAKANTNYIPVDAYSWGFNKSVQTISEYEYLGEVLPNSTYTYRLVYSQSEYATSRDLVFFDVLEGGSDVKGDDGQAVHNDSEWYGTLQYVNTGAASSKLTDGSTSIHCRPVIYYSTKDRNAFTGADWDISNTDTWTSVKPDDASSITAVAVDCSKNEDGSDFVMKGKQSLEMYITMKAPIDAEYIDKTAYNEGMIWARHENDDDPTPQYDNAAVVIRDVDPEIHKSSDPETGTKTRPADVYEDTELNYTVTVKNTSDKFTLNDIVVEDTMPTGLSVDYTNIKVHFGNPEHAIKVSTSPRVSMARTGRKLTFTVSSLLPEETVYLEIPTVVIVDHGVIENTAHIVEVNGVNKTVDSETTWHEAQPTGIAVKKTGVGGLAIPGAVLQLLDSEGTVLQEWTSTDRTEHFDVKPGDYVIHEVSAPDGYLVAEDIEVNLSRTGVLTLKSDGSVAEPVVMEDDWTKVLIQKEDPSGNLLPDAVLSIYRETDITDGIPAEGAEPVERWTTIEEAHEFLGILTAGETYVLIEESAPEGYVITDPVTFTVGTDGLEQTVTMVDERADTEVTILKKDIHGDLLLGAALSIWKLQDETDEKDLSFEEFSFVSGDEGFVIRLKPGRYVLHETEAPLGYELAEDIRFTVTPDGTVEGLERPEIIMTDDYRELELSVVKQVNGNMGDKTKAFHFRLTLTASEIFGLPDAIPCRRYVDGEETVSEITLTDERTYDFELAHGNSVVFTLPYGTGYTVTELDGEDDGYTVTGLNTEGTLTDTNVAVQFTNTKNVGIPTGFVASTGVALAFLIPTGMALVLLPKRRRKTPKDDEK